MAGLVFRTKPKFVFQQDVRGDFRVVTIKLSIYMLVPLSPLKED